MQSSLFTTSIELQLTDLRANLARQQNVTVAKMWSNKAMQELLNAKPQSLTELESVKGFGKKKAREFGIHILPIFNGTANYASDSTPTTGGTETLTKLSITESQQSPEKVLSVSDYLDYINHVLKAVADVKVIGEISRISNHPTGVYLTIKDTSGDGVLDCYINPYTYRGLGLPLEEGMEIKITGTPGIFKRRSQLSFRVDAVELAGEGSLKKAYELLKKKLEQEGIFDRKRELPEFIASLGLITSKTGAVIDDFRNNLHKRGNKLYLKDCRVEGNQSANQIIAAIKYFNIHHPELDCLVVMRGGGSLEDMQAFNNEAVVKEVFASRIPVIAALGHDRDVPLVCLAADHYTSTPTAAAMLINNSWSRVVNDIPRYEQLLIHTFQLQLDKQKGRLSSLTHKLNGSMQGIFQHFAYLEEKVLRGYSQVIIAIHNCKQLAEQKMLYLVQAMARAIQRAIDVTVSTEKLLAAASPERSLRLGYSLTYDANMKLVRSTSEVKTGDTLQIRVADGDIDTIVN